MDELKDYVRRVKIGESTLRNEIFQFVDDFRLEKNVTPIEAEIGLVDYVDFLFAATAHQLCIEMGLRTPSWLHKPLSLSEPYFFSQLEGLKLLALRDSPGPFRARNIFVQKNFLDRA